MASDRRRLGNRAGIVLVPFLAVMAVAIAAAATGQPASAAAPATPATPATPPTPASSAVVGGQVAPPAAVAGAAVAREESDDYTRYELLAPDSAQFHILYEVTATRPGATAYFNPIRKGSEASGESVRDRASGRSLEFAVVSGDEARRSGAPDADLDVSYLRIRLPRPVPATGGVRLLIEKTYKDPKSYYRKGADRIVFARALGIRRDAIVLPAGYELMSCNVPAQVLSEPDGRIKVSFMHTGPDAAPLVIEARKLDGAGAPPPAAGGTSAGSGAPATAAGVGDAPAAGSGASAVPVGTPSAAPPPAPGQTAAPHLPRSQPPAPPAPAGARGPSPATAAPAAERREERLAERAHQDRTIVYFLRQPESHSFDLYHDYTESRAGTDKYLNVVRKGSSSSAPSAVDLDTGETLRVETLRGEALRHAGLDEAELREVAAAGGGAAATPATAGGAGDIAPDTEVVIARFPPVREGQSVRLRIAETYTDPRSYRIDGDRLVFDRSFGRPRNAVVLPAGWSLTANAIPAIVTETADGRLRLDYVNPRPDEIDVLIEARRRPPG